MFDFFFIYLAIALYNYSFPKVICQRSITMSSEHKTLKDFGYAFNGKSWEKNRKLFQATNL